MKPYLEASLGTRLQVRLDVTWVQVCYAHQEARPGEGPELTEAEAALQERRAQSEATGRAAASGGGRPAGLTWLPSSGTGTRCSKYVLEAGSWSCLWGKTDGAETL